MADPHAHRVTAEIYGKRYTFSCQDEAEAARVRQAAELVDAAMLRVRDEQRPPTPLQTAILAALNLVDELQRLRSEYAAAETSIAERTSRLTASLGRLLESSDSLRASPNRVFSSLSAETAPPGSGVSG